MIYAVITCPDPPDGPFHIVYGRADAGPFDIWRQEVPAHYPLRARLAARVLREYGEISPRLRAIIEACTPDPEEE